jgi:ABC-type thiamin/hydroxymethylpyrimidine transport system permease subunit
MKLSKSRLGLMFGALLAACHLLWLVMVLTGVAKTVLDWVLEMHLMGFTYSVLDFNYLSALFLLVMTFVAGYISGFVLAAVLNWAKE